MKIEGSRKDDSQYSAHFTNSQSNARIDEKQNSAGGGESRGQSLGPKSSMGS